MIKYIIISVISVIPFYVQGDGSSDGFRGDSMRFCEPYFSDRDKMIDYFISILEEKSFPDDPIRRPVDREMVGIFLDASCGFARNGDLGYVDELKNYFDDENIHAYVRLPIGFLLYLDTRDSIYLHKIIEMTPVSLTYLVMYRDEITANDFPDLFRMFCRKWVDPVLEYVPVSTEVNIGNARYADQWSSGLFFLNISRNFNMFVEFANLSNEINSTQYQNIDVMVMALKEKINLFRNSLR